MRRERKAAWRQNAHGDYARGRIPVSIYTLTVGNFVIPTPPCNSSQYIGSQYTDTAVCLLAAPKANALDPKSATGFVAKPPPPPSPGWSGGSAGDAPGALRCRRPCHPEAQIFCLRVFFCPPGTCVVFGPCFKVVPGWLTRQKKKYKIRTKCMMQRWRGRIHRA